ncbi:MAG: response regulator transcription factor [Gemmatimonadota bacterium]
MSKIRVVIADDHAIVREGISSLLETQPDIEVAGEARNGQEVLDKARELKPDIILMDITMPGMSGLEATRLIREQNPDTKVLVLTMHEGDEYFFKLLDAGASGYLVKGCSSEELVTAMRAVHRGDVFLYPTMTTKLLSDYLRRSRGGDKETGDGLTNREMEILKYVADGHTNQEIAERLVLSVATVQTHRANIMAKLGLHNAAELVKYAIRHGLISLDE